MVKATRPLTAVRLAVPCKVAVPMLRVAVTTVLLSLLIRLPKASSIRTAGCCAKAAPAVAVAEGCVAIVSRLAAAGLTAMAVEVVLVRLPLVNWMVILVAMLCARLTKLTTPPAAVTLVVPCKAPLPALRVAVTTVLPSLLLRLPNWSSIRICGCGANATPAVAVLGGWVKMVSWLAAAGPTATLLEVAPVKLPLPKLIVIVSALL